MKTLEHIEGQTYHGRKGDIENAFRYSVDYILLDPLQDHKAPSFFSHNAFNLTSLRDRDHGGEPKNGTGVAWVKEVLQARGIDVDGPILLLAQPRIFGHVFNPVSFWLCHDAQQILRVVIAEVSNTFGDRHSYLCYHDDLAPITRHDTLTASKIFHVSPFQSVEGGYVFRFDLREDKIGIWIDYSAGAGGLIATLTGSRHPLTNASILRACIRRPFGSRRVLGLIHWQAFKLWWKGARYRSRPEPPTQDVTR